MQMTAANPSLQPPTGVDIPQPPPDTVSIPPSPHQIPPQPEVPPEIKEPPLPGDGVAPVREPSLPSPPQSVLH